MTALEQLADWNQLHSAWRLASRGKRGRPSVAAFEHRLEDRLHELRDELLGRRWRPGPYSSFHIHEPKRRLISAAPFRDRVVHHALVRLTHDPFERSFTADSFANRRGKGNHRALERAQQLARRHKFVLPCDLEQFFPAIDHAVLREVLFRKIRDGDLRQIVDLILASGREIHTGDYEMRWFAGDELLAAQRPRGLPIGNLTSQLWANAYLSGVDHFIKRELRIPGYVRYVDDLLLFADSQARLWEAKQGLVERLACRRMTLHAGAHPRPVTEGIPFLGFIVFPDRRRLKNRKGYHFRRKLRKLAERVADGDATIAELTASLQGWCNHVRFGNTVGLRKAVIADVFQCKY